ncbi:MAG: hypothetical protein GXO50_01370 [Chlorobi bacterium]|nr:hypothetical protein [Chlorobiota bacterium]
MKKLRLLIFFLPLAIYAQEELSFYNKGKWYLGGNSRFALEQHTEASDNFSDTFSLQSMELDAGYFVGKNMSIGTMLIINSLLSDKGSSFFAGFYTKLHFPVRQVYLFVQPGFMIGKSNIYFIDFFSPVTVVSPTWKGGTLNAGTVIPLNRSVAVEIAMAYRILFTRMNIKNTEYDYSIETVGAQVGFSFVFGKKS